MRRFRVGRRRNWYEPEDLGSEQDVRDARAPDRRFFVYVLSTTRYGHYVGHSARPRRGSVNTLRIPAFRSPVAIRG